MPRRLELDNFQAVLFDVDGTLVDSLGMIIPGLGDTIEKYSGNRPSDGEIQELIGLPIRAQLEKYLKTNPCPSELQTMTDFAIDRYEVYEDRETYFSEAIEVLRQCKRRGIKTALVTSKNDRELRDFLKRFHAADAVDTAVCATDVPHPKPAPDAALLALQRLEVAPDRAVFIGDSIYDMRCAKRAGVSTIAVSYGSSPRQALESENPDMLFETPSDLLAWAQDYTEEKHASKESNANRFRLDNDSRNEGVA